MTKSGDSIRINKKNKSIVTWITFDFVNYFYNKCSNIYGSKEIDRDIERDGMIMKKLIEHFLTNNMSKRVVKQFIDWAVDKYVNNTNFKVPVTLGYIHFWRWEYLKKSSPQMKKLKKKKIDTIVLSDSTSNWCDTQKKLYNKAPRKQKKRK